MGLVLPPLQISSVAEEDMEMNDVFSEENELNEIVDSLLATVEAMMDLSNDPMGILSGESQTPTVAPSDVQMTESSSSHLHIAPPSKAVAISSITPPKPDKMALEQAMRAGETYLWSGSRFLVERDIELKWLLRAKESNRKLIKALFPEYELPPPINRRSLSAKVSLHPDQEYPVRRILAEEGDTYLIQWEDDPDTGRGFRPTWEPKDHANAFAVAEWQQRKTHASAPCKH